MPAARFFAQHTEEGLYQDDAYVALGYIETLKDLAVDHGFPQAAVDAMAFDVRLCTVSSEGHAFSGDSAFYEIALQTNLAVMQYDRSLPLALRDADQQALYLAIELAQSVFAQIDRLAQNFGKAAARRDARTAMPDMTVTEASTPFEVVTATSRPLEEFFQIACDIWAQRLQQIKPVLLHQPANINSKPKGP